MFLKTNIYDHLWFVYYFILMIFLTIWMNWFHRTFMYLWHQNVSTIPVDIRKKCVKSLNTFLSGCFCCRSSPWNIWQTKYQKNIEKLCSKYLFMSWKNGWQKSLLLFLFFCGLFSAFVIFSYYPLYLSEAHYWTYYKQILLMFSLSRILILYVTSLKKKYIEDKKI